MSLTTTAVIWRLNVSVLLRIRFKILSGFIIIIAPVIAVMMPNSKIMKLIILVLMGETW